MKTQLHQRIGAGVVPSQNDDIIASSFAIALGALRNCNEPRGADGLDVDTERLLRALCMVCCYALARRVVRSKTLHNERRIDGRRMAYVQAAALICLLLCISPRALAAEAAGLEELKRAIDALREENRALTQRVLVLEAEKSQR